MSSPFAKKFCGKKSALTYGKGPLHNEKGLLKNPLLPIEKRALEETAKG